MSLKCKIDNAKVIECSPSIEPKNTNLPAVPKNGGEFRIPFDMMGMNNKDWFVQGWYTVVKVNKIDQIVIDATLQGPEKLNKNESHELTFVFGEEKKPGLELFKCGWDKKIDKTWGFRWSKQDSSSLLYDDVYKEDRLVDSQNVNFNWSLLRKPTVYENQMTC